MMSNEIQTLKGQPVEPQALAAQRQETQAHAAMMADVQAGGSWKSDGETTTQTHKGAITMRSGVDSITQASGKEGKCGLPNLDFDNSEDLDKPIYSQRDLETALSKLKLSMLHKKPSGIDGFREDGFGDYGFHNKPLYKPDFDNHNFDPRFNSYRKPQFQYPGSFSQGLSSETQTLPAQSGSAAQRFSRQHILPQNQEEVTVRPYHNPVPGGVGEQRQWRSGGTSGAGDEWNSEAALRRTRQLMGLDRRSV